MLMRWPSLLPKRNDIVTLGVQGIVVDDASRVLLVRHGYRPGWHLPGGGVDRGEEIETAIAREVLEETGVIISKPPSLIGIYSHFDDYPGDHIVLFKIDHWRRERIPPPNAEIAEHGFFALDALPELLSPGASRRLKEVFGGGEQSSAW
ncbi:NUDIX domain-containing protein [Hyphomicrobium sp. ghe19]|uniref:NUDIX domain-containing protein n=1 Tax=Hyphomicrobium sp. ghe19 TaxID=2682968 RepID=UPI0013673824|nr:RNA pyrophosphohydrolase [Hyphomicrobium sp. ghe19]